MIKQLQERIKDNEESINKLKSKNHKYCSKCVNLNGETVSFLQGVNSVLFENIEREQEIMKMIDKWWQDDDREFVYDIDRERIEKLKEEIEK